MFLRKFWVSLGLTIPVVLYSGILDQLFGFEMPSFPGSQHILAVLGSVIFFYGGWIFIQSAFRELKAKLPGMMTLIAIAISVAYFYSIFVVFAGEGIALFWELSTLIVVMLLGHWMEMKAVQGAQGALKELSKLLPDKAEIITDGGTKIISIQELKAGDIVLVKPGARIPADGLIMEGRSDVNEAMVTGESTPVAKKINSEVIAGTINGDGSLKVKVSKVGEQTFLAGVMRLVAQAQASKSRLQMLSDRAAFFLTVIAIGVGGLTFILWILFKAGFGFALERMVAVLVISCPHALGLAVPLVASISTTMAARSGLLVRQRLALELARKINLVLFDKTGTLTKGEYGITNIWALNKSEEEVLQLAASVDAKSEHFIAIAILREARKRNIPLLDVKEFARIPGRGAKGMVKGKEYFVGGASLLDDLKVFLPSDIGEQIAQENKKGKTIIFVADSKEVLGVFALADLIREESRQAIKDLEKKGLRIAMITGDSENVAAWVAKELGIDEYFAKVLPQEKSEKVKFLQEKGYKVAMVGDGVNDAPALTQADLGIAIGAGANVAIESAGIILVKNDPRDIPKIINLSRLTYSKMIQNLFWATGYNAVAIPLAAGILAPEGILLQPALAALFMSLSTVIVAINALLLRKKKI